MKTILIFQETIYLTAPSTLLTVCAIATFILFVLAIITGTLFSRLKELETDITNLQNRLFEIHDAIKNKTGFSQLYNGFYYDKEFINTVNSRYPEASNIHNIDDFLDWAEKSLKLESLEIRKQLVDLIANGSIADIYNYDYFKRELSFNNSTSEKRIAFKMKFPGTTEEEDLFFSSEFDEKANSSLEKVQFSKSPKALKEALEIINKEFPYPISPITKDEILNNNYNVYQHLGPNGENTKAKLIENCINGIIENLDSLKHYILLERARKSNLHRLKELQGNGTVADTNSEEEIVYDPSLENQHFSESPEALQIAIEILDKAFPYPIPPVSKDDIIENYYYVAYHLGPNKEIEKADILGDCMNFDLCIACLKEKISKAKKMKDLLLQIFDYEKSGIIETNRHAVDNNTGTNGKANEEPSDFDEEFPIVDNMDGLDNYSESEDYNENEDEESAVRPYMDEPEEVITDTTKNSEIHQNFELISQKLKSFFGITDKELQDWIDGNYELPIKKLHSPRFYAHENMIERDVKSYWEEIDDIGILITEEMLLLHFAPQINKDKTTFDVWKKADAIALTIHSRYQNFEFNSSNDNRDEFFIEMLNEFLSELNVPTSHAQRLVKQIPYKVEDPYYKDSYDYIQDYQEAQNLHIKRFGKKTLGKGEKSVSTLKRIPLDEDELKKLFIYTGKGWRPFCSEEKEETLKNAIRLVKRNIKEREEKVLSNKDNTIPSGACAANLKITDFDMLKANLDLMVNIERDQKEKIFSILDRMKKNTVRRKLIYDFNLPQKMAEEFVSFIVD